MYLTADARVAHVSRSALFTSLSMCGLLALSACSGSTGITPDPDMQADAMTQEELSSLAASDPARESAGFFRHYAILGTQYDGLESLGSEYVYEGWLIVNGSPVSTGRFSTVQVDRPTTRLFLVDRDEARLATDFVLTIEPRVDPDPGPALTKLLGGGFAGRTANLVIDHPAAIGNDLMGAEGTFFLAVPTLGDPTMNQYGIWFMDLRNTPVTGGFTVPTLNPGWTYEGWIVVDGVPQSTGRFLDPNGPDSDGGGPAAGPNPGPPFPGSDFVNPGTFLPGGVAVLSVEPEPDDSPAPFLLKPLVGVIGEATAPTQQFLSNQAAATNPTGRARLIGRL